MARPAREEADAASLGKHLRHLRHLKGLRLKDVAAAIGCSESMLSKVENDRTDPSLHMLHRLAEALGTPVQALFSDTPAQPLTVYRNGERPVLAMERHGSGPPLASFERMIPYAEGRTLNANVHVVPPGGGSNGILRHEGEEVGYVVEGTIELVVDGTSVVIGAGGSFFFQSSLPHSYRNIGTVVARVVWVNSPPY
ncbi:helix-turn-helix domain-containing protein [Labrys monachus]|uniref:Transcriptional regulator with XRE-family HTH domain n=1 Tax=Labrys monachus TaxID=217067 RepID=A0ABU0FN36_9HYPH|nr:cupin domain-containing protein [Labrys monachus]MDQ0395460.1 transcriptional regulator with XRE-family HTH domain [Labrys monachus]